MTPRTRYLHRSIASDSSDGLLRSSSRFRVGKDGPFCLFSSIVVECDQPQGFTAGQNPLYLVGSPPDATCLTCGSSRAPDSLVVSASLWVIPVPLTKGGRVTFSFQVGQGPLFSSPPDATCLTACGSSRFWQLGCAVSSLWVVPVRSTVVGGSL